MCKKDNIQNTEQKIKKIKGERNFLHKLYFERFFVRKYFIHLHIKVKNLLTEMR